MKLNKETYEAWLLDRLEGNLTDEQNAQLDAFLSAHPELPASCNPLPRVEADALRPPAGMELHRTFPPTGHPDAVRLDDFLIARMEGDLDAGQEAALERYLYEHPEAGRAAALITLARVQADAVSYPGKEALKRKPARVIPLWWPMAAAASVLLVLGLGLWFFQSVPDGAVAVVPGDTTLHRPAETRPDAAPATPEPATVPDSVGSTVRSAPGELQLAPRKAPGNTGRTVRPATDAGDNGAAREPLLAALELRRPPIAAVVEAPAISRPAGLSVQGAINPAAQPPAAAPYDPDLGQSLGQFLANRLREQIDQPGRPAELDARDAWAVAGRAVETITNGKGDMALQQRKGGGKYFRLALGRDLRIEGSIR